MPAEHMESTNDFGGNRVDAETVGLVERWAGSRGDWAGRECFRKYSPDHLHNGLSREESIVLARTPHIPEAVTLVSRGLRRTSEMERPTHEVFIRGHHANDQCCKEARGVFGEGHSIFVDRSADPSDIPDEWTDRRILREFRDEHLGDSAVIIVFTDGNRCPVSPTTDSSPRPPVPPPGGCRPSPTTPSRPSAHGRSRCARRASARWRSRSRWRGQAMRSGR